MIALVDADSILYKVAFAIEDKIFWNEQEFETGEESVPYIEYETNIQQCYETSDRLIDNILFATECDDILLAFSSSNNFRCSNPIPYKANRENTRKPEGFQDLKAYIFKKYSHVVVADLEADDVVVHMKTTFPDEYLLCAIDKDVLYQTEGVHYNYNTDEVITVNKNCATRYAYYQTLTGDASDGYKGCPGIGPVKAEKLLDEAEKTAADTSVPIEVAYWRTVVAAYESKGLTEEDAINTMRLANMHQWDGKKIKLWKPPV